MDKTGQCGVCSSSEEVLYFCKYCFLCYECAKDTSFQLACDQRMNSSSICFLCDTEQINTQMFPLPSLLQVFKDTFAIKPRRQRSILARRSKLQRSTVKNQSKTSKALQMTERQDLKGTVSNSSEGSRSCNKKKEKASNQPKSMDMACGFDLDKLDLEEYYAKHPVNISKPVKIPGHREGDSPLFKYLKRAKSNRKGHKGATKQMLGDVTKALLSWYGSKPSREPVGTVGEVFVDVLIKSYGGEGPASDHIRALAKTIQSGPSQLGDLVGTHPRLGYFAFAVGMIDGEYYSPDTSKVLAEALQRVLQNALLQDVLDSKKEYLPFVKVDVCECAVFTLFKKSKLWKLESFEDLCKRFKIQPPWVEKNRPYFMDKVEELEQVAKSLQGVNPALKAEQSVIDLDQFLCTLVQHWCEERKRIVAQIERALDTLENQHREAEIRRKNMIQKARLRPFGDEEKEILRHLLHNELAHEDVNVNEDALLSKLKTFDWQGFYKRNNRHIKNRTAEYIKQNMLVFEEERLKRERIEWDFNNWEWNDAWEWGGLRLVSTVNQAQTTEEQRHAYVPQTDTDYNINKFELEQPPPDRQVARRSALVLPPLEPLYLSQRRVLPEFGNWQREEDEVRLVKSKSMIDLRHFGGGNQLVETLCTELRGCNHPIKSLYLKDNRFTDSQGSSILAALQAVHHLKHLQYAGNVAGKCFVRALAESQGLARITTLDLSSNRLGNRFAIMLLKSIVTMDKLVDLDLSDNQIGGHPTLSYQLRMTITSLAALRKLNLSWNRLVVAEVKPLLVSLCTSSSSSKLQSLQLEFNLFRDEGLTEVSETLMHSPTLSHINLSHNLITDSGVRKMLPLVSMRHQTARCKKQLELTGNQISNECKLAVREAPSAIAIDVD